MAHGKVMVIDDEQDVRDVIKMQLESGKYQVLEAENGEEAIGILRNEDNMVNVGAILCDLRMPKMNGFDCIDYLRREAPGIPVVVVTGYPDAEMTNTLMNKGVKEYLVKPVAKEKLLGTVNKLVSAGKEVNF